MLKKEDIGGEKRWSWGRRRTLERWETLKREAEDVGDGGLAGEGEERPYYAPYST